jgi:hypothetical protein
MPSPKSGTNCSLVNPATPDAAQDADNADPGEMTEIKAQQMQTQTGKYGSTPVQPYKPADAASSSASAASPDTKDQPKHWIEIQLVGEDNKPIAGEPYKITLPDGTVDSGTLDEKGSARVDGIDAGTCQVTFPNRDKDAWQSL